MSYTYQAGRGMPSTTAHGQMQRAVVHGNPFRCFPRERRLDSLQPQHDAFVDLSVSHLNPLSFSFTPHPHSHIFFPLGCHLRYSTKKAGHTCSSLCTTITRVPVLFPRSFSQSRCSVVKILSQHCSRNRSLLPTLSRVWLAGTG